MGWIHTVNLKVAKSPVGRWFRLDGSGHVRQSRSHVALIQTADPPAQKKTRANSYFFTEIRAGLATFFAMA